MHDTVTIIVVFPNEHPKSSYRYINYKKSERAI